MAEQANCIVTKVLPDGGAGFAVREDNDEDVFIAAKSVTAMGLRRGDHIDCILVPNINMPERNPWFVRQVVRVVRS